MKRLLIISTLLTCFASQAQYIKKADAAIMIADAIAPLKTEVSWLRKGKSADSLKIVALQTAVKSLQSTATAARITGSDTTYLPDCFYMNGDTMVIDYNCLQKKLNLLAILNDPWIYDVDTSVTAATDYFISDDKTGVKQ